MKVVVTTPARQDLTAIARFIARDNPTRATTFVEHLRQKARELADLPFGFEVALELDGVPVRRRPVDGYSLFYEIQQDRVIILRILHGARDHAAIFTGPD